MLAVLEIVMVWVLKSVGIGAGVMDSVVAGDCFRTSKWGGNCSVNQCSLVFMLLGYNIECE